MRQGKTVLLVTHHVHEIPPEIRKVVMLRQGRVFSESTPGETLTSRRLSALFDYPVHAVSRDGRFQVFPAAVPPGVGQSGMQR